MAYNTKMRVKYRFKDRMGCVFFREFHTDKEARLWYERNKVAYSIKEFGSIGVVYMANALRTKSNI